MHVKNFLDVIQTLGVIVASISAICGINAWRTEMREKREAELAEEVLVCVYECRDAIRAIRSPVVASYEWESREKDDCESEAESRALDEAYVYYERYRQRVSIFNRLYSLKYRFMVMVGSESQMLFNEINQIARDIVFSARELADYWSPDLESDEHVKLRKEQLRRIITENYDGNDELGNHLDQVVVQFEFECMKLLRVKESGARTSILDLFRRSSESRPGD